MSLQLRAPLLRTAACVPASGMVRIAATILENPESVSSGERGVIFDSAFSANSAVNVFSLIVSPPDKGRAGIKRQLYCVSLSQKVDIAEALSRNNFLLLLNGQTLEDYVKKDQIYGLLYEALETEKGGVLVYETALRCAINEDLKEEWEKYLDQTRNHVTILLNVFKKLGLNPDVETPSRVVVRHLGISLVKAMEIALVACKPEAAQLVAAECVVQAETKDHSNWGIIGMVSESFTETEQQVLKKAYEEVEDEEDEHLYHTTGWARELRFDSLKMPAQLPPREEEKDVKTAIAAARVKQERKEEVIQKRGKARK